MIYDPTKIEPFEKFSKEYHKWYEKNKKIYLAELEIIKQMLPKKGKGIEIGIGTGRFAIPLGIKFGLDPCISMMKNIYSPNIYLICGICERLPLLRKSIDFALMVTTICFLSDIEEAFKEIYFVLKDKGELIIGFIDKDTELGKAYLYKKQNNKFYKKAQFYSTEEVISYLRKYGFSILSIKQGIIPNKPIETSLDGYGQGGFVTIKAKK